MTTLVGRRLGGFYLLANHLWLLVLILTDVTAHLEPDPPNCCVKAHAEAGR